MALYILLPREIPAIKTASSKKPDSNGIPAASFGGKPLDVKLIITIPSVPGARVGQVNDKLFFEIFIKKRNLKNIGRS